MAPHYQLVVERPGALDELTVLCEPAAWDVDRAALGDRVERALHERTGLWMTVVLREPGGVPRSEGKAVRVVDRRPPA